MPKILKKVYFIRHAQTDGNVGDVQMGQEALLTPEGVAQAELLATRLQFEPFDMCFTSTYQRSIDTAKIILNYHPTLQIITDKNLIERVSPSSVIGTKKDEALDTINRLFYDNFDVPGYRYQDGENWDDLNRRAGEVIDLINKANGKHILVVTHGYFMRIVIAKILFAQNLTATDCKQFIRTMHLENTGIVEVRQSRDQKWFLWRWNDHSHLI